MYNHAPSSRRRTALCGVALSVLCLVASAGCERPTTPALPAKSPKVASLVPAATDLLVGIGAAGHLVAVSNFDTQPATAQLPRVGDYQTTDWEKLAELKPDVMIVFMADNRMPAGLQQRADQLKIRLVNVETERLDDIFATIRSLGELTEQTSGAAEFEKSLRQRLDAVKQRVAGKPAVPTLVVCSDDTFGLIASNTFVDDLLTIAGGTNVAADIKTRYPSVDRERVIAMAPQAVIQLLPGASANELDRAKRLWASVPELPAVKNGRVYTITEWYVLQPGSHVVDLAEAIADRLHPR